MTTSLTMDQVKALDQGVMDALVLKLDFAAWGSTSGPLKAFVFPILKRKDGMMCAVPLGYFPEEALDGGSFSEMEDLIGPSRKVQVPAVLEEEDGTEVPLDFDLECILVDFHASILQYMRGFDPVTEGEGICTFHSENPDIFPEANSLMTAAYHWVGGGQRQSEVLFCRGCSRASDSCGPSCRAESKGESKGSRICSCKEGHYRKPGRADQCYLTSPSVYYRSAEYNGTTARPPGPHDGIWRQRCSSSGSALQASVHTSGSRGCSCSGSLHAEDCST